MLNKSLLIGLTFASLSVVATANENQKIVLDGNEVTIYENFAIQDKVTKSNDETQSTNAINPEVIASLGEDLQAIKANGNDGNNIALVVAKDQNLPSYAINSEIRYVCKSDANNCIPDGIEAERIGNSNIYKITVSNFAEWQTTINLLKSTSSVKKVYPSYNYGHKNTIK